MESRYLQDISAAHPGLPHTARYSHATAEALLAHNFDKDAIMKKRLPYERLDQLTVDILTGTR